MNGGTLKWAFSVIVWTICGICACDFLLLALGRISMDIFEKVIDKFGSIGFMTMVAQAFLHGDRNHDGIPDIQQSPKGEKDEKPNIISGNTVVIDTPVKSGPGDDTTDKPINQ